jgi:hypothetical protein
MEINVLIESMILFELAEVGNFIDVQVGYLESELNGINEDETYSLLRSLPSATYS